MHIQNTEMFGYNLLILETRATSDCFVVRSKVYGFSQKTPVAKLEHAFVCFRFLLHQMQGRVCTCLLQLCKNTMTWEEAVTSMVIRVICDLHCWFVLVVTLERRFLTISTCTQVIREEVKWGEKRSLNTRQFNEPL